MEKINKKKIKKKEDKRQSPVKGKPGAPDIHCDTSGKISLIESSFPYIHNTYISKQIHNFIEKLLS